MVSPVSDALAILKKIKQLGCEEVIVCPGGRNAPFVDILSKSNIFKTKTLFEERSAGFYACGLIKKTNKPVAVVVTSGTAVAELLPSVIEAFYQGLPLVVISADRPKLYRGSGAPQAIEQSQILKQFCQQSFDLESDLTELLNYKNKLISPLHINICFDEPLLKDKKNNYEQDLKNIESLQTENYFIEDILSHKDIQQLKQPLVIVGQLDCAEAKFVQPILLKMNVPIYAEAHSGLKNNSELSHLLIKSGANTVSTIFKEEGFDSVIRVGGIPTLRFWRDLETLRVQVLSFSKNKFSGLARVKNSSKSLKQLDLIKDYKFKGIDLLNSKYNSRLKEVDSLLGEYPNSEQTFVDNFSKLVKENSQVFLANSLPIREWDNFSESNSSVKIQTLRGANGIDGNLSYFLGLAKDGIENYCLLGDLTTLYDLASGYLYKKYYKNKKIKIIIINNGGGKIFTSLFDNKAFENNHDIEFSGWAKMFGLSYQLVNDASKIKLNEGNEVIELVPDNLQSKSFTDSLRTIVL